MSVCARVFCAEHRASAKCGPIWIIVPSTALISFVMKSPWIDMLQCIIIHLTRTARNYLRPSYSYVWYINIYICQCVFLCTLCICMSMSICTQKEKRRKSYLINGKPANSTKTPANSQYCQCKRHLRFQVRIYWPFSIYNTHIICILHLH